jgi:DNA-binding NarL/FixJ family response regulator
VSSRSTGAPSADADERVRVTAREREVLKLLAEGTNQKQIATQLTISSKTVGTHIQSLLLKFGVHSRAELVACAYRDGLVSPLLEWRPGTLASRGGYAPTAWEPGYMNGK